MPVGKRTDDAEFLRLYHAGATKQEIADGVSCNKKQVNVICKRLGVPPLPPERATHDEGSRKRIDRDVIRMLTEEGYGSRKIAQLVGCSDKSVVRIRRELGISKPTSNPHYPPEVRAKVLEMLDDDVSYNQIALTLKIPDKTVRKWFPGRGWTPKQAVEYRNMLKQLEKLDTPADRRVMY